MNKRFFSFGCSFTRWCWPTWSDYIGLNFDEYYNYGCGGADNKNILYRLLHADKKYKFTSDDTIMIMFTSFNRLSYVDKDFTIHNIGDLVDHNVKAHPIGKNYNFETAIYDNYIAIQSAKSILESKNIKYELLQSMKHDFYHDNFEAGEDIKKNLDDCLDLFKYPVMENWCYENYDFMKEKVIWKDNHAQDGHPTMKHHLDFVKEFFPQYITDKTNQYYDKHLNIFTDKSQDIQGTNYDILNTNIFKKTI
jgi:hypothetical protein